MSMSAVRFGTSLIGRCPIASRRTHMYLGALSSPVRLSISGLRPDTHISLCRGRSSSITRELGIAPDFLWAAQSISWETYSSPSGGSAPTASAVALLSTPFANSPNFSLGRRSKKVLTKLMTLHATFPSSLLVDFACKSADASLSATSLILSGTS